MSRKRDRSPEQTLAVVIQGLRSAAAARVALGFLLEDGPLLTVGYHDAAAALTLDELESLRLHLRDVLRQLVEHPQQPRRLAASGTADLAVVLADTKRVAVALCAPLGRPVTADDVQHVVVLNLLLLARDVGLQQVRVCEAPDCDEIFVRTHKQTYHSTRCQQRHFKQTRRANERFRRERRRRLRVVRGG